MTGPSMQDQLRVTLAAIAALEAEQQLLQAADALYQAAEGGPAEATARQVLADAQQLDRSLTALGRELAPQATRAMEQAPPAGGGA